MGEGGLSLLHHDEGIFCLSGQTLGNLKLQIPEQILTDKEKGAFLGAELMDEQALAYPGLPGHLIGSRIPIALQGKDLQDPRQHPALLFFFQVKKMLVHVYAFAFLFGKSFI